MWSIHHRDQWPDLDAVEESTDVGRRLDVGAFVLADPFDTLLSNISEAYLRTAWGHLASILQRYKVQPDDFSWGWLHPGETGIPGIKIPEPGQFLGWTSRTLARFDLDPAFSLIDGELKNHSPSLRCAVTWRSLKWRIAPDNYPLALRLIEAACTDESSDWNPLLVIERHPDATEPWVKIAKALQDQDQPQLDRALAEAKARYSPLGYRIVVRAYEEIRQYTFSHGQLRLSAE